MAKQANTTTHPQANCLLDLCRSRVFRQGLCRSHYTLALQDDLIDPENMNCRGPSASYKASGPGYVYVMDDGTLRKIGYSRNVRGRLNALRFSDGPGVRLVYSERCDAPRGAEEAAHRRVAQHRLRGEWFAISIEEAIAAVRFGIDNPTDRETPIHSDLDRSPRLRSMDYFERHRMPKTKINKNGRKHPDLILE